MNTIIDIAVIFSCILIIALTYFLSRSPKKYKKTPHVINKIYMKDK